MSQPSSDRLSTFIRIVLFTLIILSAIGLVIYLKRSTDVPLSPLHGFGRDSSLQLATPDTTIAPDRSSGSFHTAPVVPTDSVTMDLRVPSDAGYEDGYFAGLEDGVNGDERASYDESSQFPNPAQRRNYAEAYRRGYAQGFADGSAGREEPSEAASPLVPQP